MHEMHLSLYGAHRLGTEVNYESMFAFLSFSEKPLEFVNPQKPLQKLSVITVAFSYDKKRDLYYLQFNDYLENFFGGGEEEAREKEHQELAFNRVVCGQDLTWRLLIPTKTQRTITHLFYG
jgi:hypothetical protein